MMVGFARTIAAAAMISAAALSAGAQTSVDYDATVLVNASTGDFAPYFIGSLNGGKTVRACGAALDLKATVDIDRSRRFSWGAGAEVIVGASSANSYDLFDAQSQSWTTQSNRPSAAWIPQLYAEVKFRGVRLTAGQKSPRSSLLDERLSSGDLTRSSNARGIPGVSIGFIDFQDIPFTDGWVQIDGVVEYGRMTDDGFKRRQYNRYNYLTTEDINYTYKRCYFRTKPSQPLSVTIGMQTAGQFGGATYYYSRGEITASEVRGFRLKDVWKMFLPTEGNGNKFYEGNTLGSWDLKIRYRLKNGDELTAAFEGPWEDGSGIGRMNGTDGLWGIYYRAARPGIVTGAGIEYLDFHNQSGPLHWAPADRPGTTITETVSGGDDYYNNDTYSAYANYGMAIATPWLLAPIYNLDGFPGFAHTRARGFHAAVEGCLGSEWQYAVKYSYQHALGRGRVPSPRTYIDNSMMVRASWDAARWAPGLKFDATVAFDAGSLRGDNLGVLVAVTYSGDFNFRKR